MSRQATLRFVAALVGGLLVIELSLRLADPLLPEPGLWPTDNADVKSAELASFDDAEFPTVVFLGSSAVGAGVVASTVSTTAACQPTVYNASVAGASPIAVEAWLDRAVLRAGTPRLAVFGLLPRDFSSATYGSAYVRSMAAKDGLLPSLERNLRDVSMIVRHRTTLRDPEQWSFVVDRAEDIDGDVDGDLAAGQVFGTSFEPDAVQVEALERSIVELNERGGSTVIAALGATDAEFGRWGDPDTARRAFSAFLAGVAERTGSELIDLDELSDERLYKDSVHATGEGARLISEALGAGIEASICP